MKSRESYRIRVIANGRTDCDGRASANMKLKGATEESEGFYIIFCTSLLFLDAIVIVDLPRRSE